MHRLHGSSSFTIQAVHRTFIHTKRFSERVIYVRTQFPDMGYTCLLQLQSYHVVYEKKLRKYCEIIRHKLQQATRNVQLTRGIARAERYTIFSQFQKHCSSSPCGILVWLIVFNYMARRRKQNEKRISPHVSLFLYIFFLLLFTFVIIASSTYTYA